MPFCSGCGNAVPDNDRFCGTCGHRLGLRGSTKHLALGVVAFVVGLLVVVTAINRAPMSDSASPPLAPRYSPVEAFDLVYKKIDNGEIHVSRLGRENRVYVMRRYGPGPNNRDYDGPPLPGYKFAQLLYGPASLSGSTGLPPGSPDCPSNSWGVTMIIAQTVGGPSFMREKEKLVTLAFCVNKFSGAIKAANDNAREYLDIPE